MKMISSMILLLFVVGFCCIKQDASPKRSGMPRSVTLTPAQIEAIRRELVRSNIISNPRID